MAMNSPTPFFLQHLWRVISRAAEHSSNNVASTVLIFSGHRSGKQVRARRLAYKELRCVILAGAYAAAMAYGGGPSSNVLPGWSAACAAERLFFCMTRGRRARLKTMRRLSLHTQPEPFLNIVRPVWARSHNYLSGLKNKTTSLLPCPSCLTTPRLKKLVLFL